MTAKSPTLSVRSREVIGVDQFSQRREVFDKHDTVFLPLQSPTALVRAYKEVEPIITSNHGKTTSNFKRNTPGYSSMRETRTDEQIFDFRPRKYSDNFTSELNQSDDVDYRHTMTERTRRLSKMRRDFMTSNLHEPTSTSPFNRAGTRASMPAKSTSPIKYKIESPNLFKFPFAEPYTTPTPVRKVILDLGPVEIEGGKENEDPDRTKHQSLPNSESPSKIDHQKLFEELVKRYSPQRKPVDWTLPPTKPRIIASVPKSNSSVTDSLDSGEKKVLDDRSDKPGEDDVFEKKENDKEDYKTASAKLIDEEIKHQTEIAIAQNGPEKLIEESNKDEPNKERNSKISLTELEEKNDHVPELSPPILQRQLSKDSAKRPPLDTVVDLTIPALIKKMTADAEEVENHSKAGKKVKRKRSFLDKLLGRKKEK